MDDEQQELQAELDKLLHDSRFKAKSEGRDWDVADVMAAVWPCVQQVANWQSAA